MLPVSEAENLADRPANTSIYPAVFFHERRASAMTSWTVKITSLAIGTIALCWSYLESVARMRPSPGAGTVVSTGNMTALRFDHAAALLGNGQVLIVGGIERNGAMQPTAELFDPATNRFTTTGKPQS